MAGEWLKFDASTPEKPEVLTITVTMGWDDPDLTVGKLLRVWRWFDQQTIDGNAPGVSSALLDRLIGVSGLCNAMASVGWLEVDAIGVRLPNFDRHNGKTAKDRALTAKRVAKHKGNALDNGESNAAIVSDALPREEKRREERTIPVTPGGVTCEEGSALIASDSEPDQCPHQAIIAAFHAAFPAARHVRDWTPARSATLRTRWREKKNRQRIEWWVEFFGYCAKSKFLTGRTPTPAGRKPFELSLDWLIKSENFIKAIEGAYHETSDLDETR